MKQRLICGLICLMCFVACREGFRSQQPQGIIEYEVTYLSNKSSMPTNLLPKKITLKFSGNKNITTIEGFMGMFALSNIADLRKNRNITLLKVMDKKLYYAGERNEAPFFFEYMQNIRIQHTNDTLQIAGFKCKKAIVTFMDTTLKPFDVYYTNDLPVEEPNRLTPFKDIDGLLVAFNIQLPNIEMKVVASQYKKVEIKGIALEVPEDYKKVSKRQMISIINKLLE
ncbi:MAG: hypothetical protein N2662_11970 [Bacteroidales bacterium]|nr:hypothetical protein [Bacteroidales bacterium]